MQHQLSQLLSGRSALISLVLLLATFTGTVVRGEARADTIYSYIDEQGNPVMTDDYNSIPERYRAKVKTTERIVSQSSQTTSFGTMHQTVTRWAKSVTGTVDGFAPEISGLSPYQSRIATTAGLVGLICVIAMYMSRSQVVKFLALWVLILLGITIPVLLYTSQDGAGDMMKAKAADAAKKQQDRLQQVP
jgi:hypothetical protein